MSQRRPWEGEHGFTLMELIVTIVIIGMVVAVVSFSSRGGWMEGRRVDTATNQLAADLRQAHSRAINRLAPQTVTLADGQSEYTVTGTVGNLDLDEDPGEDVVVVDADATVEFHADGSAVFTTGANPITVSSSDAPVMNRTIEISTTTSRVEIVP